MRRILCALTVLWWVAGAGSVSAQSTGSVAVGTSFSSERGSTGEAHVSSGPGFLWRIGHGHEGWSWRYGLNWYSAHLDTTIGDRSQSFGELNLKPIMGGYGYTHLIGGRMSVSASMLGGYAFTHFSLSPSATDALRATRNVTAVDARAANALVVKPEVSAWIDLGRRVGVNVNVGYMFARPHITIQTPAGEEYHHMRADMYTVKIGVVYSLF